MNKLPAVLMLALNVCLLQSCREESLLPPLDEHTLAQQYFEEDAQWNVDNIPFFECSDKQLEEVYYYRWKMYKAHIRSVGDNSYVITEFINHVAWDREPYCTINAASMLHIYEGRWLRDDRYINSYINYLFREGGNNRSYSESIADAAYQNYLVYADSVFLMQQLDSMIAIYNRWHDHYDSSKNLYYIAAMPDATEYTIASVDASNGTAGFDSGEAFRPTINSYMYANALAISKIASMKADTATAASYMQKALALKQNVEQNLWNDSFHHFVDRFKQNNQYVHYWDFIRGRELAGLVPWNFNLPADNPTFNAAWKHAVDTSRLLGKYGYRTNEPSYEYYFKQFVYYMGQRGSQWNGPGWPYQSSLVLNGMSNFLNNYHQNIITNADYVKALRLFAQQHYLPNGSLNLVENYDPNLGGPIVYYYWSNHYNHSCFNNLIISGLCGIRPSAGDTLILRPLIDSSIHYFCLQNVLYHGHEVTVVYDEDGSRYKMGKGLTVLVDGKKAALSEKENTYSVVVGKPVIKTASKQPANLALNIRKTGFPKPSASINTLPDTSLFQAIDGRIWYFTEITNRWTTEGSKNNTDWFELDLGEERNISSAKIYVVAGSNLFAAPDSIGIEYKRNDAWFPVTLKTQSPKPVGNTENSISFNDINTKNIRFIFKHAKKQVAVTEIECY